MFDVIYRIRFRLLFIFWLEHMCVLYVGLGLCFSCPMVCVLIGFGVHLNLENNSHVDPARHIDH